MMRIYKTYTMRLLLIKEFPSIIKSLINRKKQRRTNALTFNYDGNNVGSLKGQSLATLNGVSVALSAQYARQCLNRRMQITALDGTIAVLRFQKDKMGVHEHNPTITVPQNSRAHWNNNFQENRIQVNISRSEDIRLEIRVDQLKEVKREIGKPFKKNQYIQTKLKKLCIGQVFEFNKRKKTIVNILKAIEIILIKEIFKILLSMYYHYF